MLTLTTDDILKATGGVLLTQARNPIFKGVSIDSRKISSEDLFVAIKGANHDGHAFVGDVLANGIKGVVVREDAYSIDAIKNIHGEWICVGVPDTVMALGELARFHRNRFSIPVVAITGSNGKTTTKEMTAAILKRKFRVLSTSGNFNNEIGLPLTLFQLNETHQAAVLELGMNHPGEIRRLGEICTPDIGVITNIGHSHLEGLGSIEAVKQAKGELLEKINPDGTAILNADDPRLMELLPGRTGNCRLYGFDKKAGVRAESVRSQEYGVAFDLILPDETISVNLPVPGEFMVHNALAAASAAVILGFSGIDIKAGLEGFSSVKGRMNLLQSPMGVHVVDDTYNANPASVKAAITALRDLKKQERGAVCLGDMLELGSHSAVLHEEIGAHLGKADVARLFLTGHYAACVAEGAVRAGMDPGIIVTGTQQEILSRLIGWVRPGDWVLVKGSRSTRMENIVNGLMETQSTKTDESRHK